MLLLWAAFGALGGALAYRLADRLLEETAAGRIDWLPRCPRCGAPESPVRRLALVALPLRLTCPSCGLTASREQLAVELAGALGCGLIAWQYEDSLQAGVHALALLVLLTATLTDLRARLIPNRLTYPGAAVALAASTLPGGIGVTDAALGGVAASLIAVAMLVLGLVMYRRADVFGIGDVKLALFIGLVAGLQRALWAIAAGIVAGGVIGLALVLAGRSTRATMPYGPALAIGAFLVLLLRPV